MTLQELEALIEKYEDDIDKTGIERTLSDDEINEIGTCLLITPGKYEIVTYDIEDQNFSYFETLPHLMRNYYGAIEMKKFKDIFGENPSIEDKNVRKYLDENVMNAAFRVGISMEKSVEGKEETAKALDTYMNARLMKNTMMPPSEIDIQKLSEFHNDAKVTEITEKAMARQLVMAKAMLLAQLGKYEVIEKNSIGKELDVPIYETLAHGNRTNFILPAGENSGSVIDAFMRNEDGVVAGIEKRSAATHSVKPRAFGKGGIIKSESKELRTYSPFKVFGNQYGMNIAVGGVGAKGPNKKIITGDGESGHVYMRAQEGDNKHCGSLLIGIESCEPGKANSLGHEHGIFAKKAKQSAFLADKSIVGKKVGGRQIDLSGISAEKLTNILNQFSQKYKLLQKDANTEAGREKLSNLNDMLMGKYMNVSKLMEMFDLLGINDPGLNEAVSNARIGYLNRIETKEITKEEFQQSIRAKISQETACNLAKARFAYAEERFAPEDAEEDLGKELAAGAIKELMLTHETRSLGWKLRHPIKNYRENKTISDLLTKLEKRIGSEEVASAFGFYDNTFAMNWGEDLSNDRDAVMFATNTAGAKLFKESTNELPKVLAKVSLDMRKKTPLRDVERAEQLSMREDFAEYDPVLNAEYELGLPKTDNGGHMTSRTNDMRQKIKIEDENELNNSSYETSAPIIPPQPITDKQKEI